MRIGRICRPRFSLHLKNQARRFGVLAAAAGLVLAPAGAQGPLGAATAAAGAAAAASAAAPKKSAASAAIASALGNDAAAQATTNAARPAPTEEATNGAASAGGLGSPASTIPAPPLKGVAAQCANLLQMATNLKAEVDKTTKDVLSMDVVREASQIEETARKMRQVQH